jgi:hypothetical protein
MLLQTRRTIPAKLNMLTLDVNKKCHRRKNQRKILVQHGAFNNDLGSPGLQNSSSMTPELSPTSWLSRC